ncbi:MAG: dTDP-4-dehydrorhamnose 3,5-epimerase [Gemmatimonadetes bacterium]|nr:dTDP-4-dehydrorhamnose 3,5-epimerase [Gemmatimonadota bacterium]
MIAERLSIPEVLLLTPKVFPDDRGWFSETYNERVVNEALGSPVRFVQDNHSRSAKGVLRGLHYQLPPHAQGKLVRVVRGAVFDVAVDVRRASPTYGRSVTVELTEENRQQLWIPVGFAHGFLALSEGAEVLYKTTDVWAPECERSIRWDDPALNLPWPAGVTPRLAPKDAGAPRLECAEVFP